GRVGLPWGLGFHDAFRAHAGGCRASRPSPRNERGARSLPRLRRSRLDSQRAITRSIAVRYKGTGAQGARSRASASAESWLRIARAFGLRKRAAPWVRDSPW